MAEALDVRAQYAGIRQDVDAVLLEADTLQVRHLETDNKQRQRGGAPLLLTCARVSNDDGARWRP